MSKALLDGKLSQSFLSQILGFRVRNMRARGHTRLSHCRNDGAVRAMALLIIKPISHRFGNAAIKFCRVQISDHWWTPQTFFWAQSTSG